MAREETFRGRNRGNKFDGGSSGRLTRLHELMRDILLRLRRMRRRIQNPFAWRKSHRGRGENRTGRSIMFRAGFVGWLLTEQHQNVIKNEENAGQPFGASLNDIHLRALTMAHKHRAETNGEEYN